MRRALLVLLLLLGACGTRREPGPPEDEVLARLASSAMRSLELDEPEGAARLYERALARARERDDAGAIADMGFGQATALLNAGDAPGALRVSREIGQDLAQRGGLPTPRLLLAEATALHRLGRLAEAEPVAAEVVRRAAEDGAAARRARFLIGLMAAGRGDAAGVAAARAALGTPAEAAFRADVAELAGQEALLRGDPDRAALEAMAAAMLRRDALDYRGLSRALALQAAARARRGETAMAADLLLRAGQGAQERGERDDARRWLAEAAGLAQQAGRPSMVAEARRGLAAASQTGGASQAGGVSQTGEEAAPARLAAAGGGGPPRRAQPARAATLRASPSRASPARAAPARSSSQSRMAARASPSTARSR